MIIGTATVLSRRDIETGMLGDVSSENRKVQWKAGIKMTLRNPFFGVGRDKFPNLILAFGQVATATRLRGQEVRQFTEAGVPILEALGAQLGKTAASKAAPEGETSPPRAG